MKRFFILSLCFLILACKSSIIDDNQELIIAFGSCNKQYLENNLWDDVLLNKPKVWIWGGDNIYSDTDDMNKMKQDYEKQLNQKRYKELLESTTILGTWDDHDYGLNDGGVEFSKKEESQKLFLDFLGVPKDDKRRQREGVYHSEVIATKQGSVKIIVLDTRYFRTQLTASDNPEKRYQPNVYGEGTILGVQQWKWLESELNSSTSDFNFIVSSIQFLSNNHGYETWGNFPHEVDKLKNLINTSKAKGVLILSGDRHISEFSKAKIEGVNYPIIDFTSSGLTHSYNGYTGELNPYRVGKVVPKLSFGLLKINFKTRIITMHMRGDNNVLQQELTQVY